MELEGQNLRCSLVGKTRSRFASLLGLFSLLSTSPAGIRTSAGAAQSLPADLPLPMAAAAGTTLEVALILSVLALVLVCVVFAVICTRLLYLRKRSQGGQVVTFDDVLREKLDSHSADLKNLVEAHNKQLGVWRDETKAERDAAEVIAKQAFAAAQNHSEQLSFQLQTIVGQGHDILGKEFQKIAQDMAATRELLSTIRKVAEEKKEELDLYKRGLRHTYAKDTLNHLCDARESLWYLQSLDKEYPGAPPKLVKAFSDIDYALIDKLDQCDLVEIPVRSGISIYEPEFAGRYRILEKTPAPSPELINTVCRVAKPGYMKRVQRDGKEELELFRPIGLNVYFDPSEGASDASSQQSPVT
jgi:hypothetical protein